MPPDPDPSRVDAVYNAVMHQMRDETTATSFSPSLLRRFCKEVLRYEDDLRKLANQ